MKIEPIPEKILNALSPFLDTKTGGLKSDADLKKFIRCLSQLGESMIHICTYLNIIKATDNDDVAFSLLELGLWKTLYSWLSDYKELETTPMIILLLDVFKTVPVTTELLKSTRSAKIIKTLSKHEDTEISEPSQMIVDKWMKIIKSKSGTDDSSHKEHKEHKDKKKKSSHSASGELKSSSPVNSEKSKSKIKDEKGDKEENGTVRPTINRHEHKERSAGVEEGIIKPKSRVNKKKEERLVKKSVALSPQLSAQKRSQPELPKAEPESNTKRFKIENDKNETELGRVKIIPPPARPKQEAEEDGFMAALKPAPRAQQQKKRKPTSIINGRIPTSPPNTPTSPSTSLPAPPSFYKDTLAGQTSVPVSPPRTHSTSPTENMDTSEQPHSGDDNSSSSQGDVQPADKDTAFPDLPETNGKKKRSIKWADDSNLVQVHYFELVDDERVNVNRAKIEGRSDLLKDSFGVKAMAASHIQEKEKNTWKRPVLIDLPERQFLPGRESKERDIQAAREATVLQTVYFAKQLIPESALDPVHDEDMLPSSSFTPIEIPLEFSDTPVESHAPVEETTPNTGYSNDVMETIQQLVKGEAKPGLIEALTNANPADLTKMISQVGPSNTDDDSRYQNFPPNSFQTIDDQENWYHNDRHDDRHDDQRHGPGDGSGWKQFGRDDFRGRGFNRGRGNWRGRGGFNGPPRVCVHFKRLGRCDFGNACKFSHDLANAV